MGNEIWIFIHLTNILKNATFSEKMGRKNFGGCDYFSGEGAILQ